MDEAGAITVGANGVADVVTALGLLEAAKFQILESAKKRAQEQQRRIEPVAIMPKDLSL